MPTWIDEGPPPPEPRAGGEARSGPDYSQKSSQYFKGVRKAFVDSLPRNPEGRLLEIGCGEGGTSAYALAAGKCGWCCGVELCEQPARAARARLSQVIVGNVEQIELDLPEHSFDILLLSEVLEHLVDPWTVLRRLRRLMKPGGLVRSGSPNVCHHSVVRALLRGRWRYEQKGIFDATHLRWFSPTTYGELFESCGFRVDAVGPADRLRAKARLFDVATFGQLRHLLYPQIYLQAHCD